MICPSSLLRDIHVFTQPLCIKEQLRYNLRSASGLTLKYPSLKLKKTLGDRAFSSAPLTYGTVCPFISALWTILNVLNLYLKRIFLD